MHKKLLIVMVIIISAALLVSGCGSQPTEAAPQISPEAIPQSTALIQVQPVNEAYPAPVAVLPSEPYPQPASPISPEAGAAVNSLLAMLQGAGLPATPGGDVSQAFFSVAGKVFLLDGEELQLYEYPALEAGETDASKVSADGSSVGSTAVDWISTPHFYRSGNLIIIYVGENQSILETLQSLLGEQFAGG